MDMGGPNGGPKGSRDPTTFELLLLFWDKSCLVPIEI